MPIDEELRKLLVCPQCKGELRDQKEPERLICDRCGLAYAVVDGVPNMLIEEAERTAKA
ncbi:MAG TPA: Trm112 family protein [Candidatus Polarisedimenticolia bacterium]|nr:Trm112 family protein [Candidatus Polarisedimenticolia bacterium]